MADEVAQIAGRLMGAAAGRLSRGFAADVTAINRRAATCVGKGWDIVVAHGPELAPLAAAACCSSSTRWLWRPGLCRRVVAAGGTRRASGAPRGSLYRHRGVPVHCIPVGVDPLAPQSRRLSADAVTALSERVGLDP
jgi:hypothetical protein